MWKFTKLSKLETERERERDLLDTLMSYVVGYTDGGVGERRVISH